MQSQWVPVIEQHQGSREYQQDRCMCVEIDGKGLLAVLCDGMGGMKDGDRFAETGCNVMRRVFEKLPKGGDMLDDLMTCYREANREALGMQSDNSADAGGTTLVAVLIRGGYCVWVSSGDSRIYLFRGGGLIQLTRDQNMGAVLDIRAGLGNIDWAMAKNANGRNALVGHLGMANALPCDYSPEPFRLLAGDRILEMSDGVFGTLPEDEMLALLQGGGNSAKRIIGEVIAKEKPRQDNCSVVVIGRQTTSSGAATRTGNGSGKKKEVLNR